MKEKILELRAEGKTYDEIKGILGCSKSTISYHCGKGQKEKTNKRNQKRRENNLLRKLEGYKYRKPHSDGLFERKDYKTDKDVFEIIRKFQKRDNNRKGYVNKELPTTFSWEDVIQKFGEDTVCYLSGEPVNLMENNYQLDHILPTSRGGDNSLENLGVTHQIVNSMKGNLKPEELIEWCIKILENNGYKITK